MLSKEHDGYGDCMKIRILHMDLEIIEREREREGDNLIFTRFFSCWVLIAQSLHH
ncbi:hypothetical protein HanIR_Chr11g0535001 [Helianthus annuus]|nr:hypothetical protein HanIR_Chr11g0535001 [Helianthus annuus]